MLLVHVAGFADLGILLTEADPRKPSKENGRRRDQSLINREYRDRLKELESCQTGDELASRLLDLNFIHAINMADGDVPQKKPGSALRKELTALSELRASLQNGGNDESVEILVIGVEDNLTPPDRATPTDQLARCLVDALRKTSAKVTAIVKAEAVHILDACILPSLKVCRESIEKLEHQIGSHTGHVLLALAGGATAIFAEIAGVTDATHPSGWSLALVDRTEGDSTNGSTPLVDMSVSADPLRGWLMGLGLPTVLESASNNSDVEVTEAAEAVRRAMGESSSPTAKDLAQVLWTDTARGDLAAGMALRSWIVAEYKSRRDNHDYGISYKHMLSNSDLKQKLGKVLGKLERNGEELEGPEAWLLSQRHLKELGERATHGLESPEADSESRNLQEQIRRSAGNPPPWLSLPSGQVCLLTAQGEPRNDGHTPRDPIVSTLLTSTPDEALRHACSISGPLTLSTFIACSNSSFDEGQRVADRIRDLSDRDKLRNSIKSNCIELYNYKHSTTENGVAASTVRSTLDKLRRATEKWLEQQSPRPRAVLVTTVGEKPVVIALLSAAQAFGAKHGIAVFLLSSFREKTGEVLQFHQFGLHRDVRQALLEATSYCLDRFDLLSASRLLILGDHEMRKLSCEALDLADQIRIAVRTQDLDSSAEIILGVMSATAEFVDRIPPDAQARLATIVAELIRPPKKDAHDPNFKEPVKLACAPGDFDRSSEYRKGSKDLCAEPAANLLRLLMRVRNKLSVNHGEKTLADAAEASLQNYQQRNGFSYSDLLRRTINRIKHEHGAVPGDWAAKLKSLNKRVDALRNASTGESGHSREGAAR